MPDEAENVVRDAPRPQEEQQGGRNPPLKSLYVSRDCGLNSLIIKPRANHELTRGQSAVATTELPSSPESRWDPTDRPNGARVVVQGEKHRYRLTARVDTLTTHMAVQGP